ncbi:iron uptake transporter permease EfeU [Solirhodobacter olei]|uniref:iron uptake transporter permease EfeU n=1 Tax=Solirhodobacter olei TaxID=2493082 RepID=UPI000FD73540|nr:iron uptake transporter permease EfeU [Solirhodobacter olei]
MLATFVIGLREGLEAALIVGIIAAFLRRNGRSLGPMWLGVALAVALSCAVGVGLDLAEKALPQAGQEAMETVIGAIAVVFVTGMIAWMSRHAREMKRQLEAEAAEALTRSGVLALVSMAFLAVLREGFETSVFLLATFSAAQSAALAAAGAMIGLVLAVAIGWGIYAGGVRINLSRFFRVTGGFLLLVAAGLVIASLRTAHDAGWLNGGQQATVDLGWLMAPGTVQSAMITGVLGIPADPRLIEVLGWLAYLIPVSALIYWPQARRPGPAGAARLKLGAAAALAVLAGGLALFTPVPRAEVGAQAEMVAASGAAGAGRARLGVARLDAAAARAPAQLILAGRGDAARVLALPADARASAEHDGIAATRWTLSESGPLTGTPARLTLAQVMVLNGGRLPIGLNPAQHPGPFDAVWTVRRSVNVWASGEVLLDAAERSTAVVVLSGSGLATPRALGVRVRPAGLHAGNWRVSPAYVDKATAALRALGHARAERHLWAFQLPVALLIAALLLFLSALGGEVRRRRVP